MAPLIILSGPSGSGKSTIIARLLKDSGLPLRLSVSATTRTPRPYERDGVHYWFWTREQFHKQSHAGAFLEWAEVHGQWYGTLRRRGGLLPDARRRRPAGHRRAGGLPGALALSRLRVHFHTDLFVGGVRGALRKRGFDAEEKIALRLATARRELERVSDFDHVVVNDDLEAAVVRVRALIAEAFQKGNSNAG